MKSQSCFSYTFINAKDDEHFWVIYWTFLFLLLELSVLIHSPSSSWVIYFLNSLIFKKNFIYSQYQFLVIYTANKDFPICMFFLHLIDCFLSCPELCSFMMYQLSVVSLIIAQIESYSEMPFLHLYLVEHWLYFLLTILMF